MCKERLRLWRLFCRIALRTSRSTLVATTALRLRPRGSMRIIQTVVQLPTSQRVEKCCVVLELVSNGTPNHCRFRVILRQFRNQNMKAVIDSAALVMNDVIIASYGCPNQGFHGSVGSVLASVAFQFWPGSASLPLSSTQRATTAGGKSLVE